MSVTLGRTNRAFPKIWLKLGAPAVTYDNWAQELVEAAIASGLPIDISASAALFGGFMRGTGATIVASSTVAFENSPDEKSAGDLVQAHLIETLSGFGREDVDIYFLRIRRALDEYQINGALEVLEMAKQEGHLKHIGLQCDGPALASLGMWQFHDAFEVLLVDRNHFDTDAYDTLCPLADERRVGVVTKSPLNWGGDFPFYLLPADWRLRNLTLSMFGMTIAQAAITDLAAKHPVVVNVSSKDDIGKAVQCLTLTPPAGIQSAIDEYKAAWADDAIWEAALNSDDASVRRAAGERKRKRA